MTAPLLVAADTSHDVAPFGIFVLFSNITWVTFALSIPEPPINVFDEELIDALINGNAFALAVSVTFDDTVYEALASPTLVSPLNQPNTS